MRTLDDARRWIAVGNELILGAVAGLDEGEFDAPSGLPGWNRRQLVAHVASNAEAIGHLVHWAATGEETPMYASPDVRATGIEQGLSMSAETLETWCKATAQDLDLAMDRLPIRRWQVQVRTAQGRTVPASETPWMRAREVCVHAVDLEAGVAFADLPEDFNNALCADILRKRGMAQIPPDVADAELADRTAWLAGRPHQLAAAPDLAPWL